ncbi:MAG: GDSL-type esterase/lipase family protein [Planctomycetota bacterium]
MSQRNLIAGFLFALTLSFSNVATADAQLPGRVSAWKGFPRHDFTVDGARCWVVAPTKEAEGRPWIWRARFFGHQPQADVALLERGYHVAYCDVGGLFGSPEAVKRWDALYDLLVGKHGFAKKVALEGMSRGGLIIYNWAIAHPDRVACLYGDAPVCDFKSWPGGKGKGKGGGGAWNQCLKAYGLSEDEALKYDGNPIDQLAKLAAAKVPLLHVIGDADAVVPPAENSAVIEARYRKLGGSIQIISKKGVGHHPHALKNPRPIVSFVVGHCRTAGADLSPAVPFEGNLALRGNFVNSRSVFESKKTGHVAFMGGSITEMNGYRPMVMKSLEKRFPETKFTFTNAGISSTCSTTGAFRLKSDVLSKGPVDLFLVEFAVNDDQDAKHARRECVRGLEGVLRQIHRHNPRADIAVVYFVNPGMLKTLTLGNTPLTIEAHESVASHYGVSSVNLARELSDAILASRFTWKRYGGTHPKADGNALCAQMVEELLARGWKDPSTPQDHAVAAPVDRLSYYGGSFLDPKQAKFTNAWKLAVPNWKEIPGSKRGRFLGIPLLCASQVGAELKLKFEGTAVGAYVLAGPDAGILEGTIDGKAFQPVNLYHRFSRRLHYPRTVLLASDLTNGTHELVLRISAETKSRGHAARILQFTVNHPKSE